MASAVRANTAKKIRDPVRVFVSIVKGKRWDLISQAQEDRARMLIGQYRDGGRGGSKLFHGERKTLEPVAVTLNRLKL